MDKGCSKGKSMGMVRVMIGERIRNVVRVRLEMGKGKDKGNDNDKCYGIGKDLFKGKSGGKVKLRVRVSIGKKLRIK
jgi:hypothetical protein